MNMQRGVGETMIMGSFDRIGRVGF